MHMRGFTLVEMLVVMTISVILVAMAVPSFAWMKARTNASNASNDLLAHMQLARSEAIRRNVGVTVCRIETPIVDPNAPVCSGNVVAPFAANDWGTGWMVFAKNTATAADLFDNGDTLIRVQQILPQARTRFVIESSAGLQFFSFGGNGMPNGGAGTMVFSFDYRDPAVVAVSSAGRCIAFNVTRQATNYAPTAGVC